jgi:hypothetical protein
MNASQNSTSELLIISQLGRAAMAMVLGGG